MKEKRMLRVIAVCLIIVTGGIMMFGFSGCSAQKYKVECGSDIFEGVKKSYKAGDKVKAVFPYHAIGTDTDYSFYLDGKRLNPDYQER